MKKYRGFGKLNLIACCLLLVGCSPMRYSEFTGRSKVWPTASGAMAEKRYEIPVYRGWPERPYTVIGSIRFVDARKEWDEGIISMATSTGKSKGGDAIIIRYGAEFGVGMTTGAVGDPKVFSTQQTTALVIKWKPQSELDAANAMTSQFIAGFKRDHPELTFKRDLVTLGMEYLGWMGMGFETEESNRMLEEVLWDVLKRPEDASISKWLFKGTVRASSLTTSASDVVYGVATISHKEDNLTIVSSSPQLEFNFSGKETDGRLNGQIGFSSGGTIISAKAEGVYTDEKIVLTGMGQTSDGTFQGSFSFNR